MGMNLIYSNGRPQVERINADEILKLPPEARTLPDGRDIWNVGGVATIHTLKPFRACKDELQK